MGKLSGLTAAVTGGAGELCGRMAEAIAAEGANVVILDIAGDKAAAQAEAIVKSGGRALGLSAQLAQLSSFWIQAYILSEASEKIKKFYGGGQDLFRETVEK